MRPNSQAASAAMRMEAHGVIVNNDADVVAASPLAVRYETLVRVSQAVRAHGDFKELFGVLADELHRVVQFDFIGVSFRTENLPTFQNYFIDVTTRTELLPDEELNPEEMLTLRVYERQESLLRSTNDLEPR